MLTLRRILVLPFALLALASTSAFAGQQHIVAPDQLASTVSDHVVKQDADRAAVHEALARPEVRHVVSSMGVDLNAVAAVVDTMTGTQLAQAGDAARQVNQQLVGGASTVVISTTTIILILLLVIILILALK
jgi:DNA/RNA-binding domain of Phe-tRNA-synthetase-like protein